MTVHFYRLSATLIHGITYSSRSESSMDFEITCRYCQHPDPNLLGTGGTHHSGVAGSSCFDSQGSTLMGLVHDFRFYFHGGKK